MKFVLVAFVAALLLHAAAAYPIRWVSAHLDTVPTKPANMICTDHPDAVTWPSLNLAVHGFTANPSGVSFTVTNSLGAAITPTTGLCLAAGKASGDSYRVVVTLPYSGLVFLSTTAGSLRLLAGATGATAQTCTSGSRIYATTAAAQFSQDLVVDCPSLAGVASVKVKATFAGGQNDPFQQATITLPVNAACVASVCANYTAPPPPPPPTPNPPPPPPTGGNTTNSTKPVYPECWGARLLLNPCPLGKRCFYDKDCKPQSENLAYPNCDNAAPLTNPWPAGKCCFYDSECKSQCEDKTDSRCKALNIPPCSVPGCGWCSATNPAVCDKCWAGYVLNIQTGKCDCAPGFYGTASCKQCPAGQISYGGQLPVAACVTCPAGRVANKEQTECVLARAWDHWGYDLTNRRWGYGETVLNVTNAGSLQPKWTFTAGGDVTATPTIANGRLYVPDWSGYLWCLDAVTGAVVWQKKISDMVFAVDPNPYPKAANSTLISRTSPAIAGSMLVVSVMKKGGGYPYLFTLNAADGSIVWGKRVDTHPAAMLTQSPTVHAGYIYQGVSSLEELWATDKTYPCCTFRGNMLKVDLTNGNIVWRTYMTPDNGGTTGGFSGNSIWGSSPAIDVRRNQVYISTGNNYEAPDNYTNCLLALGSITTANYAQAIQCETIYGQGNYHNSMLALDMTSGAIRWVRQLGGPDAWNGACGMQGTNPNCAKQGLLDLNSPDYDFGQAPMLVKACKAGSCKQLVVAGQKSGWLWALNPDTGYVHWSLPVGPGGTVGGLQWGSAADNTRIYVANNNYLSINTDLTVMKSVVNFPTVTNQRPPTATDGGLAAAIDAYTGELLWTFANPTLHWDGSGKHARSQAPMTVVNDVLFYPSMDPDGTLFLLDARTGKLLYSYKTQQTSGCGPAVVDGRVYVGSGYANFGLGLPGNRLHMLSL